MVSNAENVSIPSSWLQTYILRTILSTTTPTKPNGDCCTSNACIHIATCMNDARQPISLESRTTYTAVPSQHCSFFFILRTTHSTGEVTVRTRYDVVALVTLKFDQRPSFTVATLSLRWSHDGRDSFSNHQPHDFLLNRLFRRRSNKNIQAQRHWPLCGEVTGDRWIPHTNGQ